MAENIENFRFHNQDYEYVDSGGDGQVDLSDQIKSPSGDRTTVDSWIKGMNVEQTARELISQQKLSVRNFTSSLWVGQNNPRLGELQMKEGAGTISENEAGELHALRKFPNNSRARDLAFRSNVRQEMSEVDRFELSAFRAFPNNGRARDLYLRSLTSAEMSAAEKSELEGYFSTQNRQKVREK